MCDTDLSDRLLNDLTFNLKNRSIISSQNISNIPSCRIMVSDKETQTDHADIERELSINDKDADTISQTSVVKFNFDAIPPLNSPLKSPMKSPTASNGQINKTILKKQISTNSSNEILSSKSLERSHSLSNKEFSPLLGGRQFQQNGNKPKTVDSNRLSRFRERFASKKSSSIDACYSQSLTLDIPEIVLNSPEEERIE